MAYALTYFDMGGRAEIIRLLLVLAGVTYKDNRIAMSDWPAMKPNTPWGQLPFLDEDGKILAQTVPIMHYLGQKHGLGGNGAWEQAQVSSVCEAANDIFTHVSNIRLMEDEAAQTTAMNEFMDNLAPLAAHMETFIADHGRNNHTVGDKNTSADICVFNTMDQLMMYGMADTLMTNGQLKSEYRRMKGVYDTMKKNPRIASYLSNRKPDPEL